MCHPMDKITPKMNFHYNFTIRTIFILLLVISSNIRLVLATKGCKPRGIGTEGFDMSLYHYGYADIVAGPGYCFSDEYQSYQYMHGGYVTYEGGLFGTANGIINLNLEIQVAECCTPILGELPPNYNYDGKLTVSNFTMLLTGYFYAEISGDYTFNLVADDLAYLSFGAGDAFDCCGMKNSVTDPGGFNLIVIWKSESDKSGSITFTLNGGVYYPIRLLYTNRDYAGELSLTYTEPSGIHHSDFAGRVYQFPDIKEGCANEAEYTTTTWRDSYTTTYSTSSFTSIGSNGFGTIETIYYIAVPEPRTPTTSASVIISPNIATGDISLSEQSSNINSEIPIATPTAVQSSKSNHNTVVATIIRSVSWNSEMSRSGSANLSSSSFFSVSITTKIETSILSSNSSRISTPIYRSSSLNRNSVHRSSYRAKTSSFALFTSFTNDTSPVATISKFSYHKSILSSRRVPIFSPSKLASPNSTINPTHRKFTSIISATSTRDINNHKSIGSTTLSANTKFVYSNTKISKSRPTSSISKRISQSLTNNSSTIKKNSNLHSNISPLTRQTSASIIKSNTTLVIVSPKTSLFSTVTSLESLTTKNTSCISIINSAAKYSSKTFKSVSRSSMKGLSSSFSKAKNYSTTTIYSLIPSVIGPHKATILSSDVNISNHNSHASRTIMSSDSVHSKYPSYSHHTEYLTSSTTHKVKKGTSKLSQFSTENTTTNLLSSQRCISRTVTHYNTNLHTNFSRSSELCTTVSCNNRTITTPTSTYENKSDIKRTSHTTFIVHDSSKLKISENSKLGFPKTSTSSFVSQKDASSRDEIISNRKTLKGCTKTIQNYITKDIISREDRRNSRNSISQTNVVTNLTNSSNIVQHVRNSLFFETMDVPYTKNNQASCRSITENPISEVSNVTTPKPFSSKIISSLNPKLIYSDYANSFVRSYGTYGFLISNIWLLLI